jgi:GMP synthase-like glutamine amidotransferase
MILILDFGSQYTQIIARRIREENVYCKQLYRFFNFAAPALILQAQVA